MSSHTRPPLSEDHKTALAAGREQGRAVRRYLEALQSNRPRRGRPRSPEQITTRLGEIEQQLSGADPLRRLHLIQERIDLNAALAATAPALDHAELEASFVAVAGTYGERKGISYRTWREVGVPAEVLRRAGIAARR